VNTTLPENLLQVVRQKAAQPAAVAVNVLAETLRVRYGACVQAILFYGSCLRSGDDQGGMVDLYVIVDRYRNAYRSWVWAFLNKVLPPNVFYLEIPAEGRVVRAKYAILSLSDFEEGVSPAWFHSYLWGRFAQPAALLYALSPEVAERVHMAQRQAVLTFLSRVVPCLPAQFSASELWLRGLSMSYRAELRAERPEKLAGLFQASLDYYEDVTVAALSGLPFKAERIEGKEIRYECRISTARRMLCFAGWKVRALQGKLLSVLRLLKGAFTFSGGLEYLLWKIERHTGLAIEVPTRLRRHPILAICVLSWRIYRRGGFR
jgi:hypothetical protein